MHQFSAYLSTLSKTFEPLKIQHKQEFNRCSAILCCWNISSEQRLGLQFVDGNQRVLLEAGNFYKFDQTRKYYNLFDMT